MGNRLKYWPGSLGSTPSLSDELMRTLSNFFFPHIIIIHLHQVFSVAKLT